MTSQPGGYGDGGPDNPALTSWIFAGTANGEIGPYRLIRQIGEGGMGFVYHAHQIRPIRRDVALKIIRPGMDSKQVIALMEHPNIARVFDAGNTPVGLPYFAMELVDGVPITRYCDSKRLGVKERIALFIPVCRAVQHAYQKGIIHRDLKPSNILVAEQEGKPVPKDHRFRARKSSRFGVEQRQHDDRCRDDQPRRGGGNA